MQKVSPKFHQVAAGSVIPLSWSVLVSFDKKRSQSVNWFTLDNSTLNGDDVLSTLDTNPTQVWDAYNYMNATDRIIDSVGVSRSVEFPYSVQSAVADFSLNNYDGYFDYSGDGGSSPVAEYMLPRRPARVYFGFGGVETVPVFVGLTQGMPKYSEDGETVGFTAIDFLSEIGDQSLRETIKLKDARTDEVIALILKQYGMTDDQFKFDRGQNVIPFAIFDKNDNAGDVLKKLVQAENGALWLDELGVVRFTTRTGFLGRTPVMHFDKSNIIKIKQSRTDDIVNVVKITSDVRVVQANQPVFQMENEDGWNRAEKDDQYRVPPNRSLDIWLNLEDPAWEVDPFVIGGKANTSTIQVVDLNGKAKTSEVRVAGSLLQDTYKLTIYNDSSGPISVSGVELWGKPAKVVDTIKYETRDEESVERFGVQALEITDNDFFGSYRNADLFAVDVLTRQAAYSPTLDIDIKGNPALQIGDIITVDYKFVGDYIITAMTTKISSNGLETNIKARRHHVAQAFILDVSQLDGKDLLG